jgi:X-X-X-Leu-X-X-Gly heptad repeat protein
MCFVSYQGFAGGSQESSLSTPSSDVKSTITGETNAINNGTNTITNGTNTIINGTNTINNGTNTINNGTNTINSGNTIINEENITLPRGGGDEKPGEPGGQSSNQETSDRIPVTSKIVEYMLKNDRSSDGLKFYLSKPFVLKIYEQKETAEVEFINGMVILNSPNPAKETILEFKVEYEGKLIDIPGPDKGRELQIFFQEHDGKTLIFRRNVQLNCYELSSVKILDNRSYETVFSNDPPRLYVHGQDNRDNSTTVQVIPVPDVPNNNQQIRRANNTVQSSNNINISNDSYTYSTPSPYVMGPSSLNRQNVITYVGSQKRGGLNRKDRDIIEAYFNIAGAEKVNVDIAIAQMLHCTSFLTNQTLMNNNNYAGLSSTPRWTSGKFNSISDGVRAHIQHLKFYASPGYRPANIIDPRYSVLVNKGYLGKVQTFDQLYNCWSENRSYGRNIDNILNDLYRSSGVRH